jgi:tyrosinase
LNLLIIMRTAILSASLAVAGVSALPQITPATPLAPALPLNRFDTQKFAVPLSLDDILGGKFPKPSEILDGILGKPDNDTNDGLAGMVGGLLPKPKPGKGGDKAEAEDTFHSLAVDDTVSTQATCSNPRVRQEWDSYSDSDRQAFVSAVRCLMGKPASGQFSQAKSRYEDLVALHQTLTPNVHGNSKFLLWHRYYLFTFEDVLRSECGFDRALPWWDETRYSGRFAQSSIFSDQWFGGINAGGNCITNGVSSPHF